MAYTVQFLPSAQRELSSLPREIQARIREKLDGLAVNPRPAGAKILRGGGGRLRIRVGDYRVIYRILEDRLVVLVVKVGNRREVYRGM